MKLETPSADFSDEQKRYLEGFMSGLQVGRVGRSIGVAGRRAGSGDNPDAPADTPDLQAGHEAFQIPFLFVAEVR